MSNIDFDARRKLFAELLNEHSIDRSVIVTGSFRAGTSFICSMLRKNGLLSIGQEKFSKFSKFRRDGDLDAFRKQLSQTFSTSQDGLFSCKLMWPHRNNLSMALGYGRDDAAEMAAMFPDAKWINIVRRDKVAQAVSFWKAKLTKRWHVKHGTNDAEPDVEYDFEGIRKAFVELSGHDMLWHDFHARAGTGAPTLIYEDFLTNVDGNLLSLLNYIGDHGVTVKNEVVAKSPLKMQRNAQSEEFCDRFLADFYLTGY